MGELAQFLSAAASFGDEAAGPSCAAPAAACSAPPRTPSSAAPAARAAAPPALPAAEAWGLQAAQVAACAPDGGACAAAGAASHSALDNECLCWEPFGGVEKLASFSAAAEARGAAGAQPLSASEAHSVREQMAELEQGLHAVMACAELPSAPPAYAAPAEPACTPAEGPFARSACSAGAAHLPASPPGGSALAAAPCATLPAARRAPCQAPGLGSPLTSAKGAPTFPSAPQLPVHLSSSPLRGQATRGPPQRALPGVAALRQSLQAEDAATPLAAGLRFGAWVDALGPPSVEQAQSGQCQEEAFRACGGHHPAGPDAGSAGLAGGGGGWGGAPGAWAECAARSEEGAARRAGHSCISCARGTVAKSAAWPEAGSADSSEREESGASSRQDCGGSGKSVVPLWKRSPADAGAVTARPYGLGGPPWQPARADAGAAAAPASGNPFAGLPASCAAGPAVASPETLAHGNPFRRATVPKAMVSSGSS